MAAILPLILLAVVLALALVLRVPQADALAVRREWRHVLLVRLVALGLAGGAALIAHLWLDLGRGPMLAGGLLGLGLVAGVAAGEALVRPPRDPGPRGASLVPRRLRDYLPRVTGYLVGALTGVHLLTLVLTTWSASADDLDRAGRVIAHQCGSTFQARGPYPGSFYTMPLAMLLTVTAAIAILALVVVVRRPRGFAIAPPVGFEGAGPDSIDGAEDALRRRSVATVVAGFGAAVAFSHAGIAFFAGFALLRMDCSAAWMTPIGVVLLVTAVLAVGLLGWFLVRVLTPGQAR